jgi:chromosome segregation ATPase
MTDDEREKFDAIRMNLELTGHDLESMRERMENLTVACEELRKTAESHERRMQGQDLKYEDVRNDIRSIATSTERLITAIDLQDRRIKGIEGRI